MYRSYLAKRFAGIRMDEFANGIYAIDLAARDSWEAIEEFPPYTPQIDEGKVLWETPFANGNTYGGCFSQTPGQRQNYPRWDSKRGMIVTLPLAINLCRAANGEPLLDYLRGEITILLAYLSFESRGQATQVEIPADDNRAAAAYERGKAFFFQRRGQLNFSCASCHMESAGLYLRTQRLSPAMGHTTHWPAYRADWGELGTLHRRFQGCSRQVRAKPFAPQSEQYRNLEYFLSYMSNDIPYNGPSTRR